MLIHFSSKVCQDFTVLYFTVKKFAWTLFYAVGIMQAKVVKFYI